jgi:serine/threonine-protein kinase HipA
MTKRFDRLPDGSKLHMQSLCAIAHYDFNYAGAYSYEQAIEVIGKVVDSSKRNLARQQMFLRAVFNIVGRNQDDHTKNISFLMDKKGCWRLSPAYDLIYSYNPNGEWTSKHQMMVNGKREDFNRDDLIALASFANIKKAKANKLIDTIVNVFANWSSYANVAGVKSTHIDSIEMNLLTKI